MPTAYSRDTMNIPPLGPFLDPQRVAVIGGATGMGAATVRMLRETGRKVAALDINPAVLKSEAEFSALGDVTDAANIKRAIDEAADALGGLEAIVCCVGINGFGTVEETEPEEWHRQFAVNAFGPYASARAAIPHLRKAGGGAIVVLTSQVGIVGQKQNAAYCAAKAAAIHLVRCLAIDYAAENIRVNTVCPGSPARPACSTAGSRTSRTSSPAKLRPSGRSRRTSRSGLSIPTRSRRRPSSRSRTPRRASSARRSSSTAATAFTDAPFRTAGHPPALM